jgi:phage tail sheath gpL-like
MAGLTGLDPSDPLPRVAREFVFAAGVGAGISDERKVVLIGNLTAAGTATADVITDPIESDADSRALFGSRSEAHAMFRRFMMVAQDVEIRAIPVAESGGTAAALKLVIADDSDSVSGWRIDFLGERIFVPVASGDQETTTATAVADAINSYDGGQLPVTAVAAIDGGGPDYKVDVTFSHKGTRGTHVLNELTVTALGDNGQTITKSTLTSGATEDDWTNAIIELSNLDDIYYVVAAKTDVQAPTATDNGLGELQVAITNQALPINGKDMRLFYGMVGTSAESTTVPVASPMNSVYAHGIQLEDCPLLPGQIAAYTCAAVRAQEIAHPGANTNGIVMAGIPAPLDAADYPTSTEQKSQLNNGVTPLAVEKGRVVMKRFITNRSMNDDGDNDYRAREGHIASVAHFVWNEARQRWAQIRQPFADFDPTGDVPPPAKTTVPALVRGMWEGLFDSLCSSAPLQGRYQGPILAPSRLAEMKARLSVQYDGAGRFPTVVTLFAVQHNLGTDVSIQEASPQV